jgi:predicted ATPase/DNA-binding CsgD family transcriptional regulator
MGCGESAGRLRGELTEFVGRRAELALVRQVLGTARLVTLTGPGGIGKTRLALQAAAGARRAFGDGVWLAELSGLQDPALLVPEVARLLGLSDQSARWAVANLSEHLDGRRVLLVLDQCEHLADACAVMSAALLRDCPGLRIMATSRHVLGVVGEVTIAVPPMSVPAEVGPRGPEELLRYEAVRLFADRAAAVLPGFTLDADNGPAVAGVCRRLDGIPLAIELAAVRLRSLSPEQILSRLDSRFPLLSSGGAAVAPHHRTLQAALEWSYGLLTEAEQAMWRRVSVFAASFDMDAAEAVCAGDGIAAGSVVDLVDGLVAKSILFRGPGNSKVRYRLLDTVREFGLQKLRSKEDERAIRARHRSWYAALAVGHEAFGPPRAEWIASLDADHENLRAALEFCLAEPRYVTAGAEMACELWRYWETHGHLTEGRRILAAALAELAETAEVRPQAMWVAGFLAAVQGDLTAARPLLEAALSAARKTGDTQVVAYASSYLGYVLYSLGEPGRVHALVETGLSLHRESANQIGVAMALTQIGFIHLYSGEPRAAAERFAECARVSEHSGNLWSQAFGLWGLGTATWLLADHAAAAAQVGSALRIMRDMDHHIGVALCLDALAWIAAARKQPARALTLLGAADTAWPAIPAALPAALCGYHDAALEAARASLPGTGHQEKGAAMTRAEAIAYALGESPRAASRSAEHPAVNRQRLTRREQEVAGLITRGLSNSQIASALVISPRTAETHVQHIMTKLGFSTRAEIAAWSAASQAEEPTPR